MHSHHIDSIRVATSHTSMLIVHTYSMGILVAFSTVVSRVVFKQHGFRGHTHKHWQVLQMHLSKGSGTACDVTMQRGLLCSHSTYTWTFVYKVALWKPYFNDLTLHAIPTTTKTIHTFHPNQLSIEPSSTLYWTRTDIKD